MQPKNEHKQLIVIDFEYAGANVRGLEFANHFTEWTYNYHDAAKPYACNPNMYPKPEEQYRFIRAYVEHRPQFQHHGSTPNLTPLHTPTGTPGLGATTPSSSSIVDFMLDARIPPGQWRDDERRREEQLDKEIKELMEETRLWRIANSAQWVAWGLMQAKVPGLDDCETPTDKNLEAEIEASLGGVAGAAPQEEDEDADEFDYLGYAQERALFFWGDCVMMGFVKLEDFPEALRGRIKMLEY
jgi:choline kinase